MGFLQPEIIRADFVSIDGLHGTTNVPADVLKRETLAYLEKHEEDDDLFEAKSDDMPADVRADLLMVYDGPRFRSARIERDVYGARLSAPGYLDCTEWTLFQSRAEAEEYLKETFGDDSEESTEKEVH